MARIPSIDNSYWFGETNGFVSKKTMIEQALDANAKTDKAQSEDIKANAEAIAENAKADEQQAQDIQSNANAIAENAANDEKQSESISANADAIAENTANDEKQSEDIQANTDAIAAEAERAEKAESDLQKAIEEEATARANEDLDIRQDMLAMDTALNNAINLVKNDLEKEVGAREDADKVLDDKISENTKAIENEVTRAESVESELDSKISDEVTRAMGVEGDLDTAIKAEADRAEGAEKALDDKIMALESSIKDELAAEVERAEGAEKALDERVDILETKNFVEWETNGQRKKIVLDNYENILGKGFESDAEYNLVMVSKWDVADFGSSAIHMELNTKDNITVVAGANKEVVAYKSDVENAKGDAEALVTELKEGEVAANATAIANEQSRAMGVEEALDGKVETINNTLNTLLNTSGASEVIDTFKDVEKFLEGITDSETLTSLVKNAVDVEADRAMSVEEGLQDSISALESVKDDYKAADETLKSELESELADKTSHMVEWMENGQRKMIVLDNYENILGRGTDNNPYNLVMVSKWDVADFGSSAIHMNLNSVDDVTVNDKEKIALQSWVEEQGFLTEHQPLDAYALKSELEDAKTQISSNSAAIVMIHDDTQKAFDEIESALTNISESIPTKVSELDNDANYLTEHQSLDEYVTKAEIAETYQIKGDYALKSELPSVVLSDEYVTVEYPSEFEGNVEIKSGDSFETAISSLDTKVKNLVDEVLSNETTVADSISKLSIVCGTNEALELVDFEYGDSLAEGIKTVAEMIPSIEGLAKSADIEASYQPKGEYLTEHQDLSDYAFKSELPSVEGFASEEWVKTHYTPTEATVEIAKDTQKAFDDAEKMINANTAAINGLNLAVKALRDSMAETIKSEVVLGESLDEKKAYTFNPENGDLYIINSEVSGEKGTSNGKVMFTASTVNISSVNAHDIEGTYNLFEQGQTVDKDIEELVVSDLTIDGTLKHNIVNAYNLANDAKITLKNVKVNGCNPSLTNLVRISNYKNVSGVTITFDNVSVDYMEGYNASDYEYFGFLLYQAVSGKDSSFNGTSCVDSWTVIFKDCFLNGEPVESLNFGTEKQVAYTFNFGGGNSVTSIDDPEKSNMTVRFE